jgi:cation:H+ antiporter
MLPMLSSIFFLIVGSIGLYFGSEWLIDGAKNLAKRLKISDLVIGLTIVSIGTSFPELVIGLISAWEGYNDFILGNVLGSNIANIGLALGLPALLYNISFHSRDLTSVFIYNLIAVAYLYYILLDDKIIPIEAQGLLFIFVIYMIGSFLRPDATAKIELDEDDNLSLINSISRLVAGAVMLWAGSDLFVNNGAAPFARELGVSEKAVGMTVVAIGTSLPEIFVTLMALSRKAVGISLGNIIGSNIFNILFVLGSVGLVGTIDASPATEELLFGLFLLFLLWIFGMFFNGLNKFSGAFLVLLYIIFAYLQFS